MGSYVPNTSEEQQEMLRKSALTALRRCFPISPGGPCKRRFKASLRGLAKWKSSGR